MPHSLLTHFVGLAPDSDNLFDGRRKLTYAFNMKRHEMACFMPKYPMAAVKSRRNIALGVSDASRSQLVQRVRLVERQTPSWTGEDNPRIPSKALKSDETQCWVLSSRRAESRRCEFYFNCRLLPSDLIAAGNIGVVGAKACLPRVAAGEPDQANTHSC